MDEYSSFTHRLVAQNTKFNVYFDTIYLNNEVIVRDFLVLEPKALVEMYAGVKVLLVRGDEFGLARAYNHPTGTYIYKLYGGFISNTDSTPEDAATREIREEMGVDLSRDRLRSLGPLLPEAGILKGAVALYSVELTPNEYFNPQREIPEFGQGELVWLTDKELKKICQGMTISADAIVSYLRYITYSI